MRFRDRLRAFMSGRYGRDQLNIFLSAVCIVLLIVSLFIPNQTAVIILIYAALLILVYTYFRMMSRNYAKRSAENQKFLKIFKVFDRKKKQIQDKEHAYFKCPNCKKQLRVPKGKGRISIHCPQCGTDFIEKT